MIDFDFKDFEKFLGKLRSAADGDWKKQFAVIMQELSVDFLRYVADEIERRKVVDTRKLINSFGVLDIRDAGLTIEVGTEIAYAKWRNDGHWTNPKGVAQRFVPGVWRGKHFIYDPNAKTGMVLKQQWVEGALYWDAAIRYFEKKMPGMLEAGVQKWLNEYFK